MGVFNRRCESHIYTSLFSRAWQCLISTKRANGRAERLDVFRLPQCDAVSAPHDPHSAFGRTDRMIKTQTLLADMIFWAAVTLPVVVFVTAKIANYALRRAKQRRKS
jgi:hypothetical protein